MSWQSFPPLHLQGRGTAEGVGGAFLALPRPLHYASHGPPPLEIEGRRGRFQGDSSIQLALTRASGSSGEPGRHETDQWKRSVARGSGKQSAA